MNVHLQRAQVLLEQSRVEQAVQEIRQALTLDPDDARAHALLALCLTDLNHREEATQEAQAAIHLAPDQFLPHYALAVVLHRRRLLREARAAIGEAIRIDPYSSSAFATLASIEVTAKRWSEAVAAAEKGLEHDPDDRECTNMRAIALVKLGRQGEAAAAIEAALARDPDDAVTHANLGWALLHEGEAKQALGHFREALRLEPELEWARAGIVEALKARNFLYRWMLKWFLWMSRFNTSVQIALVLGILVGQQLLVRVINAVPVLEPLFWPIVILYLGFAWLTWCASGVVQSTASPGSVRTLCPVVRAEDGVEFRRLFIADRVAAGDRRRRPRIARWLAVRDSLRAARDSDRCDV